MRKLLIIFLLSLIPFILFSQGRGIKTKSVDTDTLTINHLVTDTSGWVLVKGVDGLIGKRWVSTLPEVDPIYAADSAYLIWWNDTVLLVGTKWDIDSLAAELQDSLTHRLDNRINGSAAVADSVMYFNRTTGRAETRVMPETVLGDSLAWIYEPTTNSVRLRHITDSVAVGLITPTTEFTIANNVAYVPEVFDSTDFDDGISVDEMTRVMVYDDTESSWYDWTFGSGAEIAAGQEGQLITIFSVSTGVLYLKNNLAGDDVVFAMWGGDNITIQYVDATWIEVSREDFYPYTASTGVISVLGVTSVAARSGTGILLSGDTTITSTGTFTITNTAPDQTVTLTDAGGITVGGTYPNLTVANTYPFYTAVGTWPIFVSGTSTTTIAINEASATDSGYITSADWNTFNDKLDNVLTTTGDLIYSSSGTTPERLGVGTVNQVLASNGTTPYWASALLHDSVTIGTPANGLSQISQEISLGLATTSDTGALSARDWNVFNQKVSSVTGSAPVVSSGGTTPDISMSVANAATNGYLSSTNWTTFNNKVGGSGTIGYLTKLTGSNTIGNSLAFDNASYIRINAAYTTDYKLDVYGSIKGRYKLHLDGATTGSSIISQNVGTVDSVTWTHTATDTNYSIGMTITGTDPPAAITIDTNNLVTIASRSGSYILPLTAGDSGKILMTRGDADTLQWVVNSAGMYRYSAYSSGANNVEVLATFTGITATYAGGVITFTIPSGVKIISAKIRVDAVSTVTVDMGTVDMGNTSMSDRWMPLVQAWREDTGQPLMGMTSFIDLVNYSKFIIYNLTASTTCQIRLGF